jgi:DedD protein
VNIQLKQRLVGALVLVALAAVFWPMIFEAPQTILLNRQSQVPKPPPFQKFKVVEPELVQQPALPTKQNDVAPVLSEPTAEANDSESVMQAAKSEDVTAIESDTKSRHQLDARGLPVAWVVQVGSFGQKENAEKLKQELRAKNLDAYTRKIDTPSGKAVRVFVGPKLDKQRAEEIKQQIDEQFKLENPSMVVRFES